MQPLIGLDWGTSSLRAMLFDETGGVRETRERAWGLRRLPAGGFDAALDSICEGWPELPLVASGMVGSRQGWREAPYVDVPATTDALAASRTEVVAASGRRLWILPGVRDPATPDVMRGEEVQAFGVLDACPDRDDACIVLPGTHSKWVRVRQGAIVHLHTYMTGELFALLRGYSILGAGASDAASADDTAFLQGVDAARTSGSAGGLHRLFQTRARMLAGTLAPDGVPEFLSGLLIGEELRAAQAAGLFDPGEIPLLAGDAGLCQRYRSAAGAFGWTWPGPVADAAARGLWRIGQALLGASPGAPETHARGVA